jgi:hypothetical protein
MYYLANQRGFSKRRMGATAKWKVGVTEATNLVGRGSGKTGG